MFTFRLHAAYHIRFQRSGLPGFWVPMMEIDRGTGTLYESNCPAPPRSCTRLNNSETHLISNQQAARMPSVRLHARSTSASKPLLRALVGKRLRDWIE